MARKEWKKASESKKQEIWEKIQARINKITNLQKGYQNDLDVFEAVTDQIESYFECDMDCSTCSCDDRATCMQNFKIANIFMLKKNRLLLELFDNYMDAFSEMLQGAGTLLTQVKPEKVKEIEDAGYFT